VTVCREPCLLQSPRPRTWSAAPEPRECGSKGPIWSAVASPDREARQGRDTALHRHGGARPSRQDAGRGRPASKDGCANSGMHPVCCELRPLLLRQSLVPRMWKSGHGSIRGYTSRPYPGIRRKQVGRSLRLSRLSVTWSAHVLHHAGFCYWGIHLTGVTTTCSLCEFLSSRAQRGISNARVESAA
jgi:hypothetical protein